MADEEKTFGQRLGSGVLRFLGGTVEHTVNSGYIGAKRGAIWGGIGGLILGSAVTAGLSAIGSVAVLGTTIAIGPLLAGGAVAAFAAGGIIRSGVSSVVTGQAGIAKSLGMVAALGLAIGAVTFAPGLAILAGAVAGGVSGAYNTGLFAGGIGAFFGMVTGGVRKIRDGEKSAQVEAQKTLDEKKYRHSQMQAELQETAQEIKALEQAGALNPQMDPRLNGQSGGRHMTAEEYQALQQGGYGPREGMEEGHWSKHHQHQGKPQLPSGKQSPAVARHLRRDLQMQQEPQGMRV
jgi:hypothetical protein